MKSETQNAIRLLESKPTISPEEFRTSVIQMSRNKLYGALKRGEIEALRIGKEYHIPTAPWIRKLSLGAEVVA